MEVKRLNDVLGGNTEFPQPHVCTDDHTQTHPWSRVPLEKPILILLLKNFITFYGT